MPSGNGRFRRKLCPIKLLICRVQTAGDWSLDLWLLGGQVAVELGSISSVHLGDHRADLVFRQSSRQCVVLGVEIGQSLLFEGGLVRHPVDELVGQLKSRVRDRPWDRGTSKSAFS